MITNLRHLRYVVAVAEYGSIAAASHAIGVSQPAISAAVKTCETEFGVRLFVRSPAKPLSMTPNGREFVARTRAFLDDAQDYHMRSLGMSRAPTGRVDIACFFPIAPYLMPLVIRALAKSNPGISINLSEGDLNEVIHLVKNGNVEAALTYDTCSDKDVSSRPCSRRPPMPCCRPPTLWRAGARSR
jgi:DNA-binding transcriptional LysR family regulator